MLNAVTSLPTPAHGGAVMVGVISDTHGLLRPEAVQALAGAALILHAGDIGPRLILDSLAELAPVVAVRGNNDTASWARELPEAITVRVAEVGIYMRHDLKTLPIDPAPEGHAAVVTGHTHRPAKRTHDGVLYLNPGAAGPRRFRLPISVARLHIQGGSVQAEIIEIT